MGDLQCSPPVVNQGSVNNNAKHFDDLLLVALTEAGLDEIAAKPDAASPTISENTDSSSDPASLGPVIETSGCMLQPSCSTVEPVIKRENVDIEKARGEITSSYKTEVTSDRNYAGQVEEPYFLETSYEKKRLRDPLVMNDGLAATTNHILVANIPQQKKIAVLPLKSPHPTPAILRARRLPTTIQRQTIEDHGIVRSRRLESADSLCRPNSEGVLTFSSPVTVGGPRCNSGQFASTTPNRGRFVIVRRRTPNGTVLIRRPAEFYNVQPRRIYINRDGEEIVQGSNIRSNVSNIRQQPIRLVQAPSVLAGHALDGRGRRVLTHSSVHYETGHQYLSSAPRQTAYLPQRAVQSNFNVSTRASTSGELYRKISDTSEYAPAVRHITRVSSAQSLGSRRLSFDSSGKQVASNFWNCELKNCNLVKSDDQPTRRLKVFVEREDSKSTNMCRNQKVESLEAKNDFVPSFVAKYEEVGGSEEITAANAESKAIVIDSPGSRKTQIKVEDTKKDIKFFLDTQSVSKIIERKDVVKQDRKMAKDEMKAALEAGVNYSMQEIDDEVENMGYAETYADYRPAKLRSGLAHPDCVVETASLSSVTPPDIYYNLTIPEELIDTGGISAVQLEAVLYACQAHETKLPNGERTGYLIGDGAGVGKGRSVACIIFENYLLGRKRSIWLSVSSDLKFDAERDLRDIGATKIKVHALNKFKYAKISGKENGNVKKGCIFATYSSLIGECRSARSKYRTRLKQLIQWCGKEFDGVIVLDECHRAKNLVPSSGSKPTKTGRMVLELQKALPNARIVYASATGATEPRNMAYMVRLGLWGEGQAFPKFDNFINAVERHGVGAMEIVAMDMKQRGLYLARQLSFRGVTFRVEEVPLSANFIEVYDDAVKLWLECRRQFQAAINSLRESERVQSKQIWGQFWAAHQRFFKYLCIGAKVDACVKIARDAVKTNKCVVIGLQSTGEARTLEVLDDFGGELTDFVSTAKAVLTGLISKHFPTAKNNGGGDIFTNFDKLFNEFDRPAKRKRAVGKYNQQTLTQSYSSSLCNYPSKRIKFNDEDSISSAASKRSTSSDSESCVDSEDESDNDNSASSNEEEEGDEIKGDEDTWLKRLMDEVKSSDEEDSDGEESQNDTDTEDEHRDDRTLDETDDDVNPFACDFSRGEDPWASKQQIISDSPQKEKKKLKKRKKAKKEIKVPTRKKALESEAMMNSADAFISSSRIIDDEFNEDLLSGGSIVKAELLAAAERLGTRLPPNTLDQLINELGGPEYVAEMTGRKGRVVSREDGEIEYELRHAGADVPLELMNMDEKEKFMRGEKLIAVISEAASSGISLQSDRRAPNRRRRVHITLELPWSADKAIQQFGRTHRSNQVSAPEYIFLISELAGEKRFASIVAKRLESLGALTHGDRRATESRDLSQFNLDNRYGRSALDVLLKSVIGYYNPPMIPPPADYKPGNFMADMARYLEGVGILTNENGNYAVEKDSATIAKFLNRILGLPVHAQNALFQYFADIVAELVRQAKHDGSYDMGIMDLGMGGDEARKLETRVFLGRVERGSYRVEIHKIGVERGVSWEDAYAIWKDHHEDEDGFYVSNVGVNGRKAAILVYGIGKKMLDTGARLYCVTRPSTGRSAKLETLAELSKRFRSASPEETEDIWKQQYEGSRIMCQHKYFHGRCKSEAKGVYCETGRRTRTYFVLSGSVLSVWPVVEESLSSGLSSREVKKEQRMQIIRIRTEEDLKIVGLLILPQYVRTLVIRLEEHCGNSFVEQKESSVL